jgi:hypothetical protein
MSRVQLALNVDNLAESISAPNGERWEVYTVLADSATFSAEHAEGSTCCGTEVGAEPAPSATACC